MSVSNKPRDDNIIEIRSRGQHYRIPVHKILFVESDDRKIVIRTIDNEVTCYHRISDFELMLDASFYRCHRSYIVNLRHIMGYSNYVICLVNGTKVPVSRRKYTELKKVLSLYNNG